MTANLETRTAAADTKATENAAAIFSRLLPEDRKRIISLLKALASKK